MDPSGGEKAKAENPGGRPRDVTPSCKKREGVMKTEDIMKMLKKNEEGGAPAIKDVTVCSLDAEALYPSLDAIECSKLCGKLVKEGNLDIVGVDYVWAGLYIALNCTQGEVYTSELDGIVPYRRFKNGTRPGINNVNKNSKNSWKWPKDPEKYSEEEKKKILGKVVEIAVKCTFETHFYQREGHLYRQKKGGAIGLKATGTISRIAMEESETSGGRSQKQG